MRDPWIDRFRTPTDRDLLERYTEPIAPILEELRTELNEFDGVAETIEWMGIPWRWAFHYAIEGDPTPCLAVLAPMPERPSLCIPLTHDLIDAIPARRLTRFIRDAIQRGPRVGGVLWCEWEVTARNQAAELIGLLKRKHQFARGPAN